MGSGFTILLWCLRQSVVPACSPPTSATTTGLGQDKRWKFFDCWSTYFEVEGGFIFTSGWNKATLGICGCAIFPFHLVWTITKEIQIAIYRDRFPSFFFSKRDVNRNQSHVNRQRNMKRPIALGGLKSLEQSSEVVTRIPISS